MIGVTLVDVFAKDEGEMKAMTFTAVGTANGANVYRSACGNFRLTSKMVSRRLGHSFKATTYRQWTAIDLRTGADVATATSLAAVKERLAAQVSP